MAKPAKNDTIKVFKTIAKCCELLGWSISFNSKAKKVKYLIIGEPKIVEKILKQFDK